MPLILTIETAIALVQRGLGTAKQIATLVQEGRATVLGGANRSLTSQDVEEAVTRAVTAAGHAGDGAAGRIEDRRRDG